MGLQRKKLNPHNFHFTKAWVSSFCIDDKTPPSKNSFFCYVFLCQTGTFFFSIVYALKPQQLVASKIPPYKLDQHLASINVWHMSNVAFDVANDVVKLAFCFFHVNLDVVNLVPHASFELAISAFFFTLVNCDVANLAFVSFI